MGQSMHTAGDALKKAQQQIDRMDAQYLLARLTGRTRASLLAHPERELPAEMAIIFETQVAARAAGVPVAQIIGCREFYGREFVVNEHVLIPRPETELLVEQALARLSGNKCPQQADPPRVLDLGTGSGAIAVTLALECPHANITAVDLSVEALKVARQNATALGATVTLLKSNWYHALDGQKFDLIVANPPYIAKNDVHLAQGDLRFEPPMALTDNSNDGLASICTIITGAAIHLNDHGWLLFEHGYDQAESCRALLAQHHFTAIESVPDLAGILRVTLGQMRVPHPSTAAAV